jgi:hypothetical protein
MKHLLLALALLAPPLLAADPLAEYTWGGGKSPLATASVRVDPEGKVDVRFRKQGGKEEGHAFALTDDELAALRTLARVNPLGGTAVPPPGAGSATLTVSGKAVADPEDGPLVRALWRLIHQGVVTRDLIARGDAYAARNACTPLAAAKVYCPRLLADPLKAFVAACDDKQKVEWGLEGLAYVLSEEQWSGFVGAQIEKAGKARRALLLAAVSGHPFFRQRARRARPRPAPAAGRRTGPGGEGGRGD